MVEIGATVRNLEHVGVRVTGGNGRLRHTGHSIGGIVQRNPVPVNGSALGKFIGDVNLEYVAGGGLDRGFGPDPRKVDTVG